MSRKVKVCFEESWAFRGRGRLSLPREGAAAAAPSRLMMRMRGLLLLSHGYIKISRSCVLRGGGVGLGRLPAPSQLKEEPEEQRGDDGDEEGCLLPHS